VPVHFSAGSFGTVMMNVQPPSFGDGGCCGFASCGCVFCRFGCAQEGAPGVDFRRTRLFAGLAPVAA